MNKAYIIKALDVPNCEVTILDSSRRLIRAKICETTVISEQGTATVLGFISDPKLISEFSCGDGKPYVWDSDEKTLLSQCEDVLENKKLKDYALEDWIMLSDWK